MSFFFFFNDTATTEIYTLSLHDALPISRVTFTVVATHAALVNVKLSAIVIGSPLVLFQGTMDGVREIAWDGLLANRRLAPPGRYTLAVVGRSRVTGAADSARVYFDLRHEVAALEDTLPDLDQRSLLPERVSPEAARRDVVKGVGVAAAALLIAGAANGDLGGSERGAADVVAATAAITGGLAVLADRRHGAIPENVAANARPPRHRDSGNAGLP